MAARGSALSRAVAFFREGNMDEVRVAFTLVKETVDARMKATKVPQAKGPVAKRHRRTKAEIAADQERESRRDAVEQGVGASVGADA